jgi:hypothetical protein
MPMLHVDDAIEHLIAYLLAEITKPPSRLGTFNTKYECDLWIPEFVRNFWHSRDQTLVIEQSLQHKPYYTPFYDAAWELCRIGVLRPGENAPMGGSNYGSGFQGDGFSLTEFGRGWVGSADQHPPSDPSRFAEVIQPFASQFGEGFAQRAIEAARCHRTTNYLACCVMAGAAAESILLALAIAKVGDESKVLAEYRGAHGRNKITNRITGNLRAGLKDQFAAVSGILGYWRDEAAHGTRSDITEFQAQASLSQLLRFAQLASGNWELLTH